MSLIIKQSNSFQCIWRGAYIGGWRGYSQMHCCGLQVNGLIGGSLQYSIKLESTRVSRKLRPRKHRPQTSDLENPDLENTDLENPDLENTDLENPDLENTDLENTDLENPDLAI